MTGIFWSLLMAALFGFSHLASRKGLTDIAVDQGTFIMVVVSTILMAVPFFWLGGPALVQQSDLMGLLYFLLAGLLHFVGGFTLLNMSISRVGAARTSSLIATTPLFATLLAAITLNELLTVPLIAGVVVVIAGVRLVGSSQPAKTDQSQSGRPAPDTTVAHHSIRPGTAGLGIVAAGSQSLLGVAGESTFGLLAALSWGISPVLIKKGLESVPSPIIGLTLAMASAGLVYLVILIQRGRLLPLLSELGQPGILWQTGAGALVGLGALCRWIALSFTTTAMVTTLSRASLLITVGLGGKLLGRELEPISSKVRWGATLIVVGSIIVVLFGRP